MNIQSAKKINDNIFYVKYDDDTESYVPNNNQNIDYQNLMKWIKAGNTIESNLEDYIKKRIYLLNEINNKANKIINTLSGICSKEGVQIIPDFEISTWGIQANEANGWNIDKTFATPSIDSIYHNRNLSNSTIDEFRQKVYDKASAYTNMIFSITGQRQKLEDLLNATPDEELDSFSIQYDF